METSASLPTASQRMLLEYVQSEGARGSTSISCIRLDAEKKAIVPTAFVLDRLLNNQPETAEAHLKEAIREGEQTKQVLAEVIDLCEGGDAKKASDVARNLFSVQKRMNAQEQAQYKERLKKFLEIETHFVRTLKASSNIVQSLKEDNKAFITDTIHKTLMGISNRGFSSDLFRISADHRKLHLFLQRQAAKISIPLDHPSEKREFAPHVSSKTKEAYECLDRFKLIVQFMLDRMHAPEADKEAILGAWDTSVRELETRYPEHDFQLPHSQSCFESFLDKMIGIGSDRTEAKLGGDSGTRLLHLLACLKQGSHNVTTMRLMAAAREWPALAEGGSGGLFSTEGAEYGKVIELSISEDKVVVRYLLNFKNKNPNVPPQVGQQYVDVEFLVRTNCTFESNLATPERIENVEFPVAVCTVVEEGRVDPISEAKANQLAWIFKQAGFDVTQETCERQQLFSLMPRESSPTKLP